jgi:putative flippase GtrA
MISEILLWKFLKFCIVGSSGMVVDFGTTWFLKEKVRVNKYLANSAGFISGIHDICFDLFYRTGDK